MLTSTAYLTDLEIQPYLAPHCEQRQHFTKTHLANGQLMHEGDAQWYVQRTHYCSVASNPEPGNIFAVCEPFACFVHWAQTNLWQCQCGLTANGPDIAVLLGRMTDY